MTELRLNTLFRFVFLIPSFALSPYPLDCKLLYTFTNFFFKKKKFFLSWWSFGMVIKIPVKGFSFKNSEILSWAHCDSSKPGRSTTRCAFLFCNVLRERKAGLRVVQNAIFTILLPCAVNDGYCIQRQSMLVI